MNFKVKDHYYKKAKEESYLARSIYKLDEINVKYAIIKTNDFVIDFGYYPGSWVQYCAKIVGDEGMIVGVDIQEINTKLKNLQNVLLLKKDIDQLNTIADLCTENTKININCANKFDVVLSDMAPKTTGIKMVDQENSLNLVRKVFDLLPIFLKVKGNIAIKIFEGGDGQNFLKEQKCKFEDFNYLRPKSTRSCSKEIFAIGKGYKGSKV
ncbi:MAG: RlmE family RNA methyltransferase [Oligoflexia bacterium]|nr:RlmE family RNA methyltransferase [Oligoflexia bacterium]